MPGSWPARDFPNLDEAAWTKTSDATRQYNCITWAFGRANRKMWPDPLNIGDWPPGAPRELTMEAFVAAFGTIGYEPCENGSLEEGFEKIALYSKGAVPTHAARQLPDGTWTSKLGDFEDITHAVLEKLHGPMYGQVARFLRRKRRSAMAGILEAIFR